jgi:hypothetical protein
MPIYGIEHKKNETIIHHYQHIENTLQNNCAARKDNNKGFSHDRDYQRIASIPNLTFFEWIKKYPELIYGDTEIQDKTLRKLIKENEWVKTTSGGI